MLNKASVAEEKSKSNVGRGAGGSAGSRWGLHQGYLQVSRAIISDIFDFGKHHSSHWSSTGSGLSMTQRRERGQKWLSSSPLALMTSVSQFRAKCICLTRYGRAGREKIWVSCFDSKVLKPNVTQSQVYDATAKNIVKGMLSDIMHLVSFSVCRCFVRLQWNYLCIWSDIQWQNAHHGGCHQWSRASRNYPEVSIHPIWRYKC